MLLIPFELHIGWSAENPVTCPWAEALEDPIYMQAAAGPVGAKSEHMTLQRRLQHTRHASPDLQSLLSHKAGKRLGMPARGPGQRSRSAKLPAGWGIQAPAGDLGKGRQHANITSNVRTLLKSEARQCETAHSRHQIKWDVGLPHACYQAACPQHQVSSTPALSACWPLLTPAIPQEAARQHQTGVLRSEAQKRCAGAGPCSKRSPSSGQVSS